MMLQSKRWVMLPVLLVGNMKEAESVEKAKDKLIEASLNFAEALSWNRVIVKSANDQTEIWKMHNWDVGGVEGVWWDAVIDYQIAEREYNE